MILDIPQEPPEGWREEYRGMKALGKLQSELLTNGPKSLSQSWIMQAMYNDWMRKKGFKDPEHDPWCIGISINSNKPQDQNFMPFTKYNRKSVEEQMAEFPMKTGRVVKGGAVRNMEERYAEKWIAWDAGKYCGGY